MPLKPTNDRDGHAVAEKMVTLIVIRGKWIIIRHAHQPCGLTRGEESCTDTAIVYDYHSLSTGAPNWGSQTARYAVKANLRPLCH